MIASMAEARTRASRSRIRDIVPGAAARRIFSPLPQGNSCVPGGNIWGAENAYRGTMTKKLLFVMTLLLVVAVGLWAADASGKWTWEQQGRQGSTMNVTLNLKQDGSNLTGNISMPGRGGQAMETAISEGKVDGSNVSFKVVREFNGNQFVTTYKGTVNGESMDLEITRPGFGGNEAPPPVKVTAKKSTT